MGVSGASSRIARIGPASPWKVYLIAGAGLVALYAFVLPVELGGVVWNFLGLSGLLAVVWVVRVHRPVARAPWVYFAIGFALFWLGDVYTYTYGRVAGEEVGVPSLADAFYLLCYPAFMAGLLLLARTRDTERDRAAAFEALILTIGLALVAWVTLIQPSLNDESVSLGAKLIAIAYPAGDILLLAALIRLRAHVGRRLPALYLWAGGVIGALVSDFTYALLVLKGAYAGQVWLDLGWIGVYLFWGAAALHPSMRELANSNQARHEAGLTPLRLGLLTAACVMAPIVAMLPDVAGDDRYVVNLTAILLFVLVVGRMAGLVRERERSVARERILSAAGADLVAATSRDGIYSAALGAAEALAPESAARLCVIDDGTVSVVALPGDGTRIGEVWTVPSGTAAALSALAGKADADADVSEEGRRDLRLPTTAEHAFVVSLRVRGEARGLLAVAAPSLSHSERDAVAALATEVSLALESAALMEQAHRRRGEARFGSLVQHASDLITVLDRDGIVIYQSPSMERLLGWSPDEVVGTRFDRLLEPGEEGLLPLVIDGGTGQATGTEVLDCALRHRDGGTRRFEMLCNDLLEDENVGGIVLNGRDVSERKAFEDQLAHQAFHDQLTGLPNRALFVERVRHAVSRVRRGDRGLGVVFIDLDDFKTVNDSLGHAAGDAVLAEVAKRFAASVRASDTAARFGGDEFAILLEDIEGAQEAADTAERILETLSGPLTAGTERVTVRCSLGIAVVEANGAADADALIRNADAAMYIAKREGKDDYRLFEPQMHEGVVERLELRADLQRALTSDQLELHYQPVVRLADGGVTGMEALLRWRHPKRGLVPPGTFVPLAEEIGAIVPIGRWVLNEACRQGRAMQDLLPAGAPLTMSVNLSVKQLQHDAIVAEVRDALAESGLPAESLMLEITESVMMTDTDTGVRRLEELKALGVRLAMDDFGTGYSSLSYLSRFPLDVIKMDRSFLSSGASPESSALAGAVIGLGETLELEVVAEGIEYPEQWRGLRELGCELGQGFLFARPMDTAMTLEYLRHGEPAAAHAS